MENIWKKYEKTLFPWIIYIYIYNKKLDFFEKTLLCENCANLLF